MPAVFGVDAADISLFKNVESLVTCDAPYAGASAFVDQRRHRLFHCSFVGATDCFTAPSLAPLAPFSALPRGLTNAPR